MTKPVQLDELTHLNMRRLSNMMGEEMNMNVSYQDTVRFAIIEAIEARVEKQKNDPPPRRRKKDKWMK